MKARQRDDPAATLESEASRHQNSRHFRWGADQMKPVNPAGGRAMKFAYASGSKPLDGYTIKRGIGVGGFGEVYFALSDAGKEVALKRIQRNLDVELRGVKQCLNLKHINLISLWDIRTNDMGESWVVMEYVPGPSLEDIVEAQPSGLPEEDVKQWFCSTAAGVAYLHDQGIVHRDLKPANIFFDEDQQVIKIGDYGLSKYISCSRRSGQTESVGTFHYMAPEIGKGVYGKEIDIYALGIILFEVLTGRVPFEGESSQEIIMRHLTADPDLSGVPHGFQQVIRKSLLKDPELRYRNVPEMCADLPWPDIAENSQNIVKRNAVGPVMLNGHSDKPNLSRTARAEQELPVKVPSMLISDRPEIIFGELKDHSLDNSFAGRNLEDTNGHTPKWRNRAVPRSNAGPTESSPAAAQRTPKSSLPHVADQSMPGQIQEPVARAMKTGLDSVVHWWNYANVSTPVKIAILIAATLAIVANSEWLLPLALGIGFLYLVYYIFRNLLFSPVEQYSATKPKLSKREMERFQRMAVRSWLKERDISDRAMELVGSVLVGAAGCVVFNLLGLAISGSFFESSLESWATFAWMTLTSVAATWAILICGKLWEQREGDAWLRRLTLGVVGLGTGFVAFLMAGTLNIDLNAMTADEFNPMRASQFVIPGIPILPAYLILFCSLFMILRWWRQTDPVRRTRLSLLAVGLCLVWAAVLSHTFDFAPLWNCIMAVVISISVQLASPWLHPEDRKIIQMESSLVSSVVK